MNEKGRIIITCETEGASIGYKYTEDLIPDRGWRIYKEPIKLDQGEHIYIISHRIGYAPSDTLIIRN